ncbi:MAG TPA: MgtC/SapB family protein [Terrimicrobiaceae bacterium]
MHIDAQIHVLLQALCAALLGGILGWEREAAGKLAGLRTHMLVCMSVVFFVQLGQHLTAGSTPGETDRAFHGDPVRVIEALATCIAFLGAGTIIRDRDAETARGLTTAASLFVTAAIGVAVALDCYLIAAGATALALFVLRALGWIEGRFGPPKNG